MGIPLKRYWDLLVIYLKPQKQKVALLAVLLSTTIAMQLLNPQIIRYFIDTALNDGDSQSLTLAGAAFLGVALLIQAFSVASTYLGEDVGWTATNALRADLAGYTLRLDMSFHNEHTPGEMIERLDGDVMDLAIFFSQFVIRVAANLVLLVGVLVMLALVDWRVGAVMSIYTLAALWSFQRCSKLAVPHWTAARESHADLYGFVEEQLTGTEDTNPAAQIPMSCAACSSLTAPAWKKRKKQA